MNKRRLLSLINLSASLVVWLLFFFLLFFFYWQQRVTAPSSPPTIKKADTQPFRPRLEKRLVEELRQESKTPLSPTPIKKKPAQE